MSVQDPFYLVREEIQDSVREVQTNYQKWNQLPDGNAEKITLARDVQAGCDSISWQLDELDEAITMASTNYSRFKIEPDEIASRRRWTTSCRGQISGIATKIKSAKIDDPQPIDRLRDAAPDRPKTVMNRVQFAQEQENQGFIQNSTGEQAMLMRQQDHELDQLSESVNRLGAVSLTISQELDDQGALLDELDEDLEGVRARLGAVQRKLTHVIKKSGIRGQICMIVFLLVLLGVLCALAFS
mmetsp:Transcript_23706/g.51770  ORF Transcript_23706/g.51770 Transcript_23706/m.51770 type:complete len:242 (-) Transcript_23706:446-1171(-)